MGTITQKQALLDEDEYDGLPDLLPIDPNDNHNSILADTVYLFSQDTNSSEYIEIATDPFSGSTLWVKTHRLIASDTEGQCPDMKFESKEEHPGIVTPDLADRAAQVGERLVRRRAEVDYQALMLPLDVIRDGSS
ncbi:hypothetical protein MSAN_01411700 [Mycena sanguinolenta]|uniref:Uncharacterized protein n=1 Tax=Mycena sanguinolenta TaxID=230812 RepID=A0A8H6XS65_9AGAR|nr:hypothetical protein MSAN_01851800 [Mycena sanguinolenta]KAF7354965.1 hypothetical protein MSAN_01411700 [Mycena sanguinolenta]